MEHGDLAALLPEDLLADVLRRVAATPRALAVSLCVCKSWRALVDSEGLLRTELPFTGIFLSFDELPFPELFSRPPSPRRPAISGKLDFLVPANTALSIHDSYGIHDHCNGLLLVSAYAANSTRGMSENVVNPATRCWDTLPSCPPNHGTGIVRGVHYYHYLAFDPTTSSHYLVFRIPHLLPLLRGDDEDGFDPFEEASEWPPSPYKLVVYSSRTRCWEARSFVREGDAAGTVAKTRQYCGSSDRLSSVYWRGSLYVHCQTNFVMRIYLSEDKYSVIRPPTTIGAYPYLGRSEKGVYFASFVKDHIRIFILSESCEQTEWVFKHDYDLTPVKAFGEQVQGPWILEDINSDLFPSSPPEINNKVVLHKAFEWNSDTDEFDDTKDVVEADPSRYGHIDILGFHPYKEILFLCTSSTYRSTATGFAYHLRSFKVESLGDIYPMAYYDFGDSGLGDERWDMKSFPYTPCCWIEKFPEIMDCSRSSALT